MRRQRRAVVFAIRLITQYQAQVSTRLPAMCAHDETCSNYAVRQLRELGLVRGGWVAFRRYRTCTAQTASRLSVAP